MANYKVAGIGQHGKYFDDKAYNDIIQYIIKPTKAAYVGGTGVTSVHVAAQEMQAVAHWFGKDKGKHIRHSILMFSKTECITPEEADYYAQQIIQFYAPKFQVVYGVHVDTDDLHIHFAMNQISYVDGHRYEGKKKDYYDFMKYMRRVTHLPIIPVKDKDGETEYYEHG